MQILLHLNNIRLEKIRGMTSTHRFVQYWCSNSVVNFKEKKEASLLQEMFLDILNELPPIAWDEEKPIHLQRSPVYAQDFLFTININANSLLQGSSI